MIMTQTQRLGWDVVLRIAVGDRQAAEQLWLAATAAQQQQAGLVLSTGSALVRGLAVMQGRPVAAFRGSDVPQRICADATAAAWRLHADPISIGGSWPECACAFDLAVAQADLYLRQGELLGFSRSEQAEIIGRGLAAMDQVSPVGLWTAHDGHPRAEHAVGERAEHADVNGEHAMA